MRRPPTSPPAARPNPALPAGARLIQAEPLIFVVDGFLDSASCAGLIAQAVGMLGPPRVSVEEDEVQPGVRTGDMAWLPHDQGPLVQLICSRVAALVGMPLEHAESLQVVRYLRAERYLAHYDAYELDTAEGIRCMTLGGQRLVTALLYLQAPVRGGATRFDLLGVDVAPIAGRLLVFHNVGPGQRARHRLALHTGMAVEQGEKWVANLWFRERPYLE